MDKELLKDLETGLTFPLMYLGFVPIRESLKMLTDSAERENLTRHCMYLVCNELGLCDPNPRVDERLLAKLDAPSVENRMVDLNVALKAFTIIDGDGVRILEHHPIDVISFASPGREEPLKGVLCFVSNVSTEMGRRCLVFMEEDKNIEFIMDTMSKIFHLKNEGYGGQRKNSSEPSQPPLAFSVMELYAPSPEVETAPLPIGALADGIPTWSSAGIISRSQMLALRGQQTPLFAMPSLSLRKRNYCSVSAPSPPPMSISLTSREYVNVNTLPVARGLENEPWFHGEISRASAEALLHNEGDFLVRMSRNTARNFVLSGIANKVPKHFLLLDENDQKVRKQSQVFETIVQLIEHHRARNVPIISEGSELHLLRPIHRATLRK
ncbi:SHC-transforming protein 1 [Toxocara canis]|uniref:SHC-transforming protein 1 n=1 Tax=Toxocara canis TaxID=6265 RepID=A0A0B2W606_TOXCA|nr:SHC-transforming protein 1 [Toxocara canis]